MIGPGRILVLAGASAALIGAAIACTAGDEVAYTTSGLAGDGGEGGIDGADDGGRIVVESGIEIRPPIDDGGTLPEAGRPVACGNLSTDEDGGCDPTAGLGCCLPSGSTGASGLNPNQCVEQIRHFSALADTCIGKGDVFLSCLSSNADNTCCWQVTPPSGEAMNTRYRAACAQGPEACDPAVGGCFTGGTCTPVTCRGVEMGYCDVGGTPVSCPL